MIKIIAFDPGGMNTGYAIVRGLRLEPDMWKKVKAELGVIPRKDMYITPRLLLESDTWDIVIIEQFILYKAKATKQVGSKFYEVRMIGHIEGMCHELQLPVKFQMASQIKNRTYAKIENSGAIAPKDRKHAIDALHHVMLHGNTLYDKLHPMDSGFFTT